MSRHVLVKDGKVQDAVMPGPGYKPPKGFRMIKSDTANIGDSYDGGEFASCGVLETTKEQWKDYVRFLREVIVKDGIEFDIAEPGADPKLVKIHTDIAQRDEIRSLAQLAKAFGEDVVLVTKDDVLTLSAGKIEELSVRVAKFIDNSHKIAAKLIDGIEQGRISSRDSIDHPETLEIGSWRDDHPQ